MQGVYLPGDSRAILRDVPVPQPGPGQVLVSVRASGICGSDIKYIYHGHKGHRGSGGGAAYQNVIAGHEPAGVVVEVGPGCRRFEPGDRVIVYHVAGCGRCVNCRKGYMISCTSPSRQGYGWRRDGGHAPYLVAEERNCIALPDELSFVDGALIACGFGTAYEGLVRTGLNGQDALLVVGLGPVGLAAAMIARGLGAKKMVGVEVGPTRRAWATELALFDAVIDASDDAVSAVHDVTGAIGASVSIDCSGSTAGRRTAIEGAAEWGRVSLVGEGGDLSIEVSDPLLHKQLTIFASWVTSLPRMEELAQHLAAWGRHPEQIVSNAFPLTHAEQAYREAAGGTCGKVCLLPAES